VFFFILKNLIRVNYFYFLFFLYKNGWKSTDILVVESYWW